MNTAERVAAAYPDKAVEITSPPYLDKWANFKVTGRWPRAKRRYTLRIRAEGCRWVVTAYPEHCRVWPYFAKPERMGLVPDEDLIDWLRDPLRWFPELLQDERPTKVHRRKKVTTDPRSPPARRSGS